MCLNKLNNSCVRSVSNDMRRLHRGPLVLAALVIAGYASTACFAHSLYSPDKRVQLSLGIQKESDQSILQYSVSFDGQQVLANSMASFTLEDGTVVGKHVSETGEPETSSHDSTWKPVYGEQSTIRDQYNQLVLHLKDSESGYNLTAIFRCYDAGIAFRTVIRSSDDEHIHIASERTEYHFADDHWSWCTPRAQDRHDKLRLSEIQQPVERPITLQLNDSLYAAITEAALVDYAAMKLERSSDDPYCLVTSLASDVRGEQELSTPWRVLMLGKSAGELLENNELVLNLSEPCAIADTSWIKPGKVLREITLTTKGAKASVDFAAKHNFKYVEFDAGWYGSENSDKSDATTVTLDPKRSPGPLDLPYIIDYAAQHDIGVILYVNRKALEKQLDKILPLYQEWGIKGVKYGFVQTGSQEWTRWLHEAVRKAAKHKLMVDVHDLYRPTGYTRTYPNFMSQEGVRGDEAGPESSQALTTLFTRNLAGAADHTICYFDPRVTEKWTHGHQLAKAVCTYSPWQFMFWYDTPLSPAPPGKHNNPIVDTPELEFFAKVPTVWDETRVVEGEIGKYAAIARRSGNDWFIGVMNNEKHRELEIPLDFLTAGDNYNARVYRDDPSVNTQTHIHIEDQLVEAGDRMSVRLLPNGGQAMWLSPSRHLAKGDYPSQTGTEKHLFILSGQSNMEGLDPNISFTPTVQAKFGADSVVVVKDAQGGMPIQRWYKNWVSSSGEKPKSTGDLYNRLMRKVNPELDGQEFDTVTFVWMQGESDARKEEGDVYAASLRGLLEQLSKDIGRDDVNVVIGRISDYDMNNEDMKDWTRIREAQVEFAEAQPRTVWINTDDLNDGFSKQGKPIKNDLHYSVEGYKELGKRFAESAIRLIESNSKLGVESSAVRR